MTLWISTSIAIDTEMSRSIRSVLSHSSVDCVSLDSGGDRSLVHILLRTKRSSCHKLGWPTALQIQLLHTGTDYVVYANRGHKTYGNRTSKAGAGHHPRIVSKIHVSSIYKIRVCSCFIGGSRRKRAVSGTARASLNSPVRQRASRVRRSRLSARVRCRARHVRLAETRSNAGV
jgi:hypothetical protein